jgi:alanine or glycine:cation symporter, AGCS family
MFSFTDIVLVAPLVCLLLASIVLTFKTRFIQFRALPLMVRMLVRSMRNEKSNDQSHAIAPHKALFAAMSTTIGIGNIVGPAIAVRLGGPGALLGFLLAVIFGAATTFVEVVLAMRYRTKLADGSFAGGPMQYLQAAFGKWAALLYAAFGSILLVVWSSNQSNTLADILFQQGISKYLTAAIVTVLVLVYLVAGIKHIGNLASKVVPFMFFIYCGACLWVIFANIAVLPSVLKLIFTSAFYPQAIGGATVGYSVHLLLRWGLAKGIQASEAGVGTSSLPHAQSNHQNSFEQGVLAMASIYSVAMVCTLSGLVTLLTGSWLDSSIPLGMSLIAVPFTKYFSLGSVVLVVSSFLFAFGTILGNAYNGSRCFLFLTKNRWLLMYNVAVGLAVFWGSIFDVELVWSVTDYFVIPVALVNIAGVLYLTFRREKETS